MVISICHIFHKIKHSQGLLIGRKSSNSKTFETSKRCDYGAYIQGYIGKLLKAVKGLQVFHKDAVQKTAEVSKETVRKVKVLNTKVNKHLHSFHALHSSLKMERLDYAFKFSTELVVVVFSLIIVGVNVAGAGSLESFNKNLLAKFLTYHPTHNPGLYSKTTTVKTLVDKQQNGIIPSAQAQVVLASSNLSQNEPAQLINSAALITENTIEKENPDSVRGLIADQIKVYDTVSGDTIKSIADKFGISAETIMWANNLPNTTIKPGWNLVILPTSGVLHKVTNNDTVPDIAKKYTASLENIISYNNLEDASDIEPGDLLIVPNGIVPTPSKPITPVKHTIANKVVYEPAPGGIEGGHIFPWGQCTYYVATKFKGKGGIPWGGNAKNWRANSKAYGAAEGNEPVVGAIAVTTENARYGHVAYVEQVDGDRFLISEMNYKGLGVISKRWLSIHDKVFVTFIYY